MLVFLLPMKKGNIIASCVLGAVLLISVGLVFMISNLRFDYQYEKFFPSDDPDVTFFREFMPQKSDGRHYLFVALEDKKGVLNTAFLSKLRAATAAIEQIDSVDVNSITDLFNPIVGPLGETYKVPFFPEGDSVPLDIDHIVNNPLIKNTWLSEDTTAVSLQVIHGPFAQESDKGVFLKKLENTLAAFDFDGVYMAGPLKGQQTFIGTMQREMKWMSALSVLLVIVFLSISFRSWWGLVVPLLIVFLTVLWLFGLMAVLGKNITILNTLIPTILFVVGMSDVVHLLQKYMEEIRAGVNKRTALRITIKEIGWATFLTSLTTGIGFMALMTSQIEPVREFGWLTAAGVFIAFLLAIVVLPALLHLIPAPPKNPRRLDLTHFLQKVFILVVRNKKTVLVGTIAAILLSIIGLSKIEINNFLMEDWDDDKPIAQSYQFIEDHFAGYRDFELALTVPSGALQLTDAEVLTEIQKVENYLTEHYDANILVSPLTLIKGANKALNSGAPHAFELPENPSDFKKARQQMKRFIKASDLRTLMDDAQQQGRLAAKVPDIGALAYASKNEALTQFLQTEIDTTLLHARPTGIAYIIDKNNTYLTTSLTTGLVIAFALVALLMGLVYKSFTIVIIALVANTLPLLFICGIMGFSGIDLKISTSLVFTIAFGIAVDDTIHFLSRLKLELKKRTNIVLALRRTHLSTGKAIMVTTIILCAGFFTLSGSSINSTFYIGLLVSFALFFALIADLVVLPILILLFYRHKPRQLTSATPLLDQTPSNE